jgi:hypothetical protein
MLIFEGPYTFHCGHWMRGSSDVLLRAKVTEVWGQAHLSLTWPYVR